MRTKAEVLDCLTSVLGSTEEKCVRSSRSPESKLIQGQCFSAGLLDSGSGSSSEAQGSHRQLRDVKQAVVVSNGANNDDGLALVRIGHVGSDTRQRNRGAVNSRHEKTTQHDLVEVGVRATGEEAIELHQNLQIDILAFRRLAMAATHMVAIQVDTHGC